jgi:hypothetical protein
MSHSLLAALGTNCTSVRRKLSSLVAKLPGSKITHLVFTSSNKYTAFPKKNK